MNQEPAPGSEPADQRLPPAPPSVRRHQLPRWLPYFALAVVPALVVGAIVYATTGGSGGGAKGGSVAGVLDGFIRLGNTPDENVSSSVGKLPAEFPKDFPRYSGDKVHAAFSILAAQGNGVSYFVILGTSAPIDKVYEFYLRRLNEDPWQVEIARSSPEFTGIRFTSPVDPDLQGDVTIHHSELDNRTTLYVSFQDLTRASSLKPLDKPFVPPVSRPLPPKFPTDDVPVYKGKRSESVITSTYFERAPGGTSYIVSFLTKDSQDDVITSYTNDFKKRGWTVSDSRTANQGFALSIDFSDGPRQLVQGSVRADAFDDDPSYTKVDLLLQVSVSRGRGN